jgi:cell division protease FtsH
VAKALIEFETLSGEDVKLVLAGGKINRDEPPKTRPTANTPTVPRTGKRAGGLEPQTQA